MTPTKFQKELIDFCNKFNEISKEYEKELDPFSLQQATVFFSTAIYWIERASLQQQKNSAKKD